MKLWGFAAAVLAATTVSAQLRVVTYNVAQLNGSNADLQAVFAALNADDRPGFAVAPHVYVFQEVQSGDTGPLLNRLNNAAPPGVTYVLGTYTNQGEDGVGGAQALAYRDDLVHELAGGHADLSTGAGRQTDRWRLRLDDYDVTGSFFIYSSHLKASQGGSNESERLSGVQTIRLDADLLPAGSHVIYAGDFNVYSNSEPAYQEYLSAGPGRAIDPLGSGSWSGSGNAIKHSQSPLASQTGALVGGGLDDRFDFQLSSEEFHDGAGWTIMAGTYRSLGNDGNHYNQAIDSGNNTYYPGDIPRSNALAAALKGASDHLPVVVEYRMPARMEPNLPADLGRVIQDAALTVDLRVRNTAPAIVAGGAELLSFTATATGGLSGGCADTVGALETAAECPLALDTTTVGPALGQVNVTSPNDGNPNPAVLLDTQWRVLRAARPSLAPDTDLFDVALETLVRADDGVIALPVTVYNRNHDADQALLDIDAAPLAAPFLLTGPLPTGVADTAAIPLAFDSTGAATGTYVADVDVQVSDEDLPGAASSVLGVGLTVHVRALAGDVDGDCTVGLDDLLLTLTTFGTCAGDADFRVTADSDGDGCIDLDDLLLLLTGFGAVCP